MDNNVDTKLRQGKSKQLLRIDRPYFQLANREVDHKLMPKIVMLNSSSAKDDSMGIIGQAGINKVTEFTGTTGTTSVTPSPTHQPPPFSKPQIGPIQSSKLINAVKSILQFRSSNNGQPQQQQQGKYDVQIQHIPINGKKEEQGQQLMKDGINVNSNINNNNNNNTHIDLNDKNLLLKLLAGQYFNNPKNSKRSKILTNQESQSSDMQQQQQQQQSEDGEQQQEDQQGDLEGQEDQYEQSEMTNNINDIDINHNMTNTINPATTTTKPLTIQIDIFKYPIFNKESFKNRHQMNGVVELQSKDIEEQQSVQTDNYTNQMNLMD